MAFQFPTAKRRFPQLLVARKLLLKVCSGYSLQDKFHPSSKPVNFPGNWQRKGISRLLLRAWLIRLYPYACDTLPTCWCKCINLYRLPRTLHPMTQLGIGVAALNHDSSFQAAYEKGMKKSEYWTHTLEDSLNLVARLPALAARIYRNVYKPGTKLPSINPDLDLVGLLLILCTLFVCRFAESSLIRQLFQHAGIWRQSWPHWISSTVYFHSWRSWGRECISTYGSYVPRPQIEAPCSFPATDLVGSTLSDPYLSYSAALFALAGPLHGHVV